MDKFEINILGCGSATPTLRHHPSGQVVNYKDKLFMIDCGEGTQLEFRRQRLRFGRLNRIFISHLHGDHCFGLMGLISTLALLGRTGELAIYSPSGLEQLLRPQLDFFCKDNPYTISFHEFGVKESELIYEDRSLTVQTIPLIHRVPCAGFLFKEKLKEPNLKKDKLDFYEVSIKDVVDIKAGANYITSDGKVIPNSDFISGVKPSKSYAYCSDTAYNENIIPLIREVDLLYHEATFDKSMLARAKDTGHSTAEQAGLIALKAEVKELMIGHFSSRYEDDQILLSEAQTIFPNTILANEGVCKKL